jgi:hypothetical protein
MSENGNNHNTNGANHGANGNGNGNGSLTGLQRAFVDAWFECRFNGTEAAMRAGYQGNRATLASSASRLLRKDKIRAAIAERWEAHGVTAEEITSHFADWMRFDISVLFDEHGRLDWEAVRRNGRHIKRIEWEKGSRLKVEVVDQLRAAEDIARTLGMFCDRVEQEHTGEMVIRFARPEEE